MKRFSALALCLCVLVLSASVVRADFTVDPVTWTNENGDLVTPDTATSEDWDYWFANYEEAYRALLEAKDAPSPEPEVSEAPAVETPDPETPPPVLLAVASDEGDPYFEIVSVVDDVVTLLVDGAKYVLTLGAGPVDGIELLEIGANVIKIAYNGVDHFLDWLLPDDDDPVPSFPVLPDVPSQTVPVVVHDVLPPAERLEDTIASVVETIAGPYQPLTYQVTTYVDGEAVTTTEVVPGLAGVDWPWVSGITMFCICLYSLFRLMGVVLT